LRQPLAHALASLHAGVGSGWMLNFEILASALHGPGGGPTRLDNVTLFDRCADGWSH
jgi:hypothetical protein